MCDPNFQFVVMSGVKKLRCFQSKSMVFICRSEFVRGDRYTLTAQENLENCQFCVAPMTKIFYTHCQSLHGCSACFSVEGIFSEGWEMNHKCSICEGLIRTAFSKNWYKCRIADEIRRCLIRVSIDMSWKCLGFLLMGKAFDSMGFQWHVEVNNC
jgi:hypothetical protein